MKKLIYLFLFLPFFCYGQKPNFKSLRYDEDNAHFAQDSTATWYQRFKFIPLNTKKSSYLSFGGEFRSQYFNYVNPLWGDEPKDADGFVLSRYLLHSDLHLGKSLRAFVQLQSSLSNGEAEAPSAVNENPLDLHQAFLDFNFLSGKNHSLIFRIGRQELLYGSQRLVSVRDAPNNRQSFDGAKILFGAKRFKADAFFSHYVQAKNGIFDDVPTSNIALWGTYATLNQAPVINALDVYYLGIKKRSAVFDDGKGEELRHSIGLRSYKAGSNWQYDIEGLYQFGTFSNSKISAWTISANVSHAFDVNLHPKLGLKTELISGDLDYADGKLNTFNPLFPRGGYFGLAALIGPSNLFDVHPSVEFSAARNLVWTTDYDVFYRLSKNDGIYAVNGRLLYSGKGTNAVHIGGQLGTSLEYTPMPFLYVRAEVNWFSAGAYLKQAGNGKDILMSGITFTLKF
ncbi:alginate export family protein [Pedobacter sp. ISL-68]|uniref:alginate export family protein n=1 Tax=unclassified Pedobacter TaxID=2628915 RepID=UPI001BE69E29|nr:MULTISPECIES: alginate export family protein [unclassified Pedobacter]MBT2560646.1 alginate export family protein [Pedobacter sp. ISL-64]MBT2590025.1 alginate export family protein [Pedobacter sp. ISL-68]